MNIKTRWLIVAKTLTLICLAFIFNASAQTSSDKPLKAKEIDALIKELKEVVTKNSPDKTEAKKVIERWGKRKDLAGKTKSEVIEMFFDDVKSVIKDSGTQYQIYSIFSFYKQIPVQTIQTGETEDLAQTNADSTAKIRLKNGVAVSSTIGGEAHDIYVIHVKKGQTLKVQTSWKNNRDRNVEFFVSTSDNFFDSDKSLRGTETYNGKNWWMKMRKTGDYYIYVTAYPTADYTIKATVK